jgi:hypothetical protein
MLPARVCARTLSSDLPLPCSAPPAREASKITCLLQCLLTPARPGERSVGQAPKGSGQPAPAGRLVGCCVVGSIDRKASPSVSLTCFVIVAGAGGACWEFQSNSPNRCIGKEKKKKTPPASSFRAMHAMRARGRPRPRRVLVTRPFFFSSRSSITIINVCVSSTLRNEPSVVAFAFLLATASVAAMRVCVCVCVCPAGCCSDFAACSPRSSARARCACHQSINSSHPLEIWPTTSELRSGRGGATTGLHGGCSSLRAKTGAAAGGELCPPAHDMWHPPIYLGRRSPLLLSPRSVCVSFQQRPLSSGVSVRMGIESIEVGARVIPPFAFACCCWIIGGQRRLTDHLSQIRRRLGGRLVTHTHHLRPGFCETQARGSGVVWCGWMD